MTEQRVAALEAVVQELREANLQLRGTLDEQRAVAAAARPVQTPGAGVVDTRLIGKPKNFSGKDDEWHSWSTTTRAHAGAVSDR